MCFDFVYPPLYLMIFCYPIWLYVVQRCGDVQRSFRFQIFCVKWLAIVWLKSSISVLFIMLVLHMMMNRLKHTTVYWENKVNVDSEGILLQIQASCYRFRHLATDSGILLLIRASCYWFTHPATDSGILLQIQASCYRFRQSATGSCNLLQGHAIGYRVMQLATGSCNWLQGREICYRVMQSAAGSCNLFVF